MCGLLDYGVDDHHLLLVLPQYPGSLREWRAKQRATSPHFLPLCLRIFQNVVQAVQVGSQPWGQGLGTCSQLDTAAGWAEHAKQGSCGIWGPASCERAVLCRGGLGPWFP